MSLNRSLSSSGLKTAVLFLVFNRPDLTMQVFKKIREIKPIKLYVAGDGPRINKKDEEKINKVREIATNVDWPCKVKVLFRNRNLGCKKAVSEAITWFFNYEEQGIILEDDCVPHLDFFIFCENLLDRYFKDERVSVITGNNFQNGNWRGNASYFFSKYTHCWGWASWRRAWKYYQGDVKFWPIWSKSISWLNLVPNKIERQYWENIFKITHAGQIDSWAYPWLASTWYKNGLTITPNVNLVSNIGFSDDSTHTKFNSRNLSNMPVYALKGIKHPDIVEKNIEADMFTFINVFIRKKLFSFPYLWFFFCYFLSFIFKNIKKFLNKNKKII